MKQLIVKFEERCCKWWDFENIGGVASSVAVILSLFSRSPPPPTKFPRSAPVANWTKSLKGKVAAFFIRCEIGALSHAIIITIIIIITIVSSSSSTWLLLLPEHNWGRRADYVSGALPEVPAPRHYVQPTSGMPTATKNMGALQDIATLIASTIIVGEKNLLRAEWDFEYTLWTIPSVHHCLLCFLPVYFSHRSARPVNQYKEMPSFPRRKKLTSIFWRAWL